MKTILGRSFWTVLSLVIVLHFSGRPAAAQFARGGGFDPYNPPRTSGGIGFSGNSTAPYFGLGPFGIPTVAYQTPTGIWAVPANPLYLVSNPWSPMANPWMPVSLTYMPPISRVTVGGYSMDRSWSTYNAPPIEVPVIAPAQNAGRNKAFDRWVNARERMRRPDVFAGDTSVELLHFLNSPSEAEVTSGQALNAIVEALMAQEVKIDAMNPIPIDADLVMKLNFTRGAGAIGFFRNQGKIVWPASLAGLTPRDEFAKIRQQIEARFLESYRQAAGGGKVDVEKLKVLLKNIDQLSEMASAKAQSMTFADNLEVKRFLKSLEDATTLLKQPDASDMLSGKNGIKPKTVQELVRIMREKKAHFETALPGNEAAYFSLHRSLAELYHQAVPVGANR